VKRKVYAAVEGAETTRGALPHKKARGVKDAGCGGNVGVQLRK